MGTDTMSRTSWLLAALLWSIIMVVACCVLTGCWSMDLTVTDPETGQIVRIKSERFATPLSVSALDGKVGDAQITIDGYTSDQTEAMKILERTVANLLAEHNDQPLDTP